MLRHFPGGTRARSAAAATVACVVLTTLALPGAAVVAAGAPPASAPPPPHTVASTGPSPLVPFAPRTGPATGGRGLTTDQREELTERIEAIAREQEADFAVAVQDLRTGTAFSHNAHERFPTASVVKLSILTMLLLSAREEGRDLTGAEQAQVAEMIRHSDNDVTDGLYSRIGFTDGFRQGARTLGFTGTEPDPRGVWGATTTTAADQMRLLRALYCDGGPLTRSEQEYARGLMESVAPEQAWGVSASAGPRDTVGLKNGWNPREDNGGLWTVNSVGYVAGPEREYLIAVMADGHPDYATGVALAEELAATVTGAMEESRSVQEFRR